MLAGRVARAYMFNRVPFQRSSMQLAFLMVRVVALPEGLLSPQRSWLPLRDMTCLGPGLRIASFYVVPLAVARYGQRKASFAGRLDQFEISRPLKLLQALVRLSLASLLRQAGSLLQLREAGLAAAPISLRILKPVWKSCSYSNVPTGGPFSLAYERQRTSDLAFQRLL